MGGVGMLLLQLLAGTVDHHTLLQGSLDKLRQEIPSVVGQAHVGLGWGVVGDDCPAHGLDEREGKGFVDVVETMPCMQLLAAGQPTSVVACS